MKKIIISIGIFSFIILLFLLYYAKDSFPYISMIFSVIAMIISWYSLYESFLKPPLIKLIIPKMHGMTYFQYESKKSIVILVCLPMILSFEGAYRKQCLFKILSINLITPNPNNEKYDENSSFYHDISFMRGSDNIPVTNNFIHTNHKPISVPIVSNSNTILSQYLTFTIRTDSDRMNEGIYQIEIFYKNQDNIVGKKTYKFILNSNHANLLNDHIYIKKNEMYWYKVFDIELEEKE